LVNHDINNTGNSFANIISLNSTTAAGGELTNNNIK
jgi:hypothetical protein